MTHRAQLELFRERLPRKPYHTDELTTGLSIADVSRALGARYIQPNGPTHRHWIVFDVDQPAATLSWDDVGAPAPNITVTNKANGYRSLAVQNLSSNDACDPPKFKLPDCPTGYCGWGSRL